MAKIEIKDLIQNATLKAHEKAIERILKKNIDLLKYLVVV